MLLVADHGEGRGDHGEELHGNLLYEGVMRVPMIVAGPGIEAGIEDRPVSITRVAELVRAWSEGRDPVPVDASAVVRGEAMKPYIQYGWQPQVMAVSGRLKAIRDGGLQVFDVEADPAESRDLADSVELPPGVRQALRETPVPVPGSEAERGPTDEQDRRRLAALGYVSFDAAATRRDDAPNPRDMVQLVAPLDQASQAFSEGRYAAAAELFGRILEADPGNLAVLVRLAAARSLLGERARADALFERAAQADPDSLDVVQYRGLHHLRFGDLAAAERDLRSVLERSPRRLTVLEALASIAERRGDAERALVLLQRALVFDDRSADLHQRRVLAAMALGRTPEAVAAFERATALGGTAASCCDLELGVLYLAQRRPEEAKAALDRIGSDHPEWPMVLFKRAQVSVLLGEPDRRARVAAARAGADRTTAGLIARERLFEGL